MDFVLPLVILLTKGERRSVLRVYLGYMDSNLPRDFKPFLLLGGFLILIVAAPFLPARWFGLSIQTPPTQYTRIDLSAITSPEEIATDTDNDGTITWQELVTQNANYSSTTLESFKTEPVDQNAIAQLNDPNNLTASFSKNLYTASAYLKRNGVVDGALQQQAIDQLLAQEAQKIKPTVYTVSDIRVASQETNATLKAYGNSVASLLSVLITKKIITDDLAAIYSFTQSKDGTDLTILAKNKERVSAILQKLAAISTPPSAVSYHILALNRIAAYRDILDNISRAESDPVRSAITIDVYSDRIELVVRLYDQFSDYFNVQNIVFSPKDPAYFFTVGYTIQ